MSKSNRCANGSPSCALNCDGGCPSKNQEGVAALNQASDKPYTTKKTYLSRSGRTLQYVRSYNGPDGGVTSYLCVSASKPSVQGVPRCGAPRPTCISKSQPSMQGVQRCPSRPPCLSASQPSMRGIARCQQQRPLCITKSKPSVRGVPRCQQRPACVTQSQPSIQNVPRCLPGVRPPPYDIPANNTTSNAEPPPLTTPPDTAPPPDETVPTTTPRTSIETENKRKSSGGTTQKPETPRTSVETENKRSSGETAQKPETPRTSVDNDSKKRKSSGPPPTPSPPPTPASPVRSLSPSPLNTPLTTEDEETELELPKEPPRGPLEKPKPPVKPPNIPPVKPGKMYKSPYKFDRVKLPSTTQCQIALAELPDCHPLKTPYPPQYRFDNVRMQRYMQLCSLQKQICSRPPGEQCFIPPPPPPPPEMRERKPPFPPDPCHPPLFPNTELGLGCSYGLPPGSCYKQYDHGRNAGPMGNKFANSGNNYYGGTGVGPWDNPEAVSSTQPQDASTSCMLDKNGFPTTLTVSGELYRQRTKRKKKRRKGNKVCAEKCNSGAGAMAPKVQRPYCQQIQGKNRVGKPQNLNMDPQNGADCLPNKKLGCGKVQPGFRQSSRTKDGRIVPGLIPCPLPTITPIICKVPDPNNMNGDTIQCQAIPFPANNNNNPQFSANGSCRVNDGTYQQQQQQQVLQYPGQTFPQPVQYGLFQNNGQPQVMMPFTQGPSTGFNTAQVQSQPYQTGQPTYGIAQSQQYQTATGQLPGSMQTQQTTAAIPQQNPELPFSFAKVPPPSQQPVQYTQFQNSGLNQQQVMVPSTQTAPSMQTQQDGLAQPAVAAVPQPNPELPISFAEVPPPPLQFQQVQSSGSNNAQFLNQQQAIVRFAETDPSMQTQSELSQQAMAAVPQQNPEQQQLNPEQQPQNLEQPQQSPEQQQQKSTDQQKQNPDQQKQNPEQQQQNPEQQQQNPEQQLQNFEQLQKNPEQQPQNLEQQQQNPEQLQPNPDQQQQQQQVLQYPGKTLTQPAQYTQFQNNSLNQQQVMMPSTQNAPSMQTTQNGLAQQGMVPVPQQNPELPFNFAEIPPPPLQFQQGQSTGLNIAQAQSQPYQTRQPTYGIAQSQQYQTATGQLPGSMQTQQRGITQQAMATVPQQNLELPFNFAEIPPPPLQFQQGQSTGFNIPQSQPYQTGQATYGMARSPQQYQTGQSAGFNIPQSQQYQTGQSTGFNIPQSQPYQTGQPTYGMARSPQQYQTGQSTGFNIPQSQPYQTGQATYGMARSQQYQTGQSAGFNIPQSQSNQTGQPNYGMARFQQYQTGQLPRFNTAPLQQYQNGQPTTYNSPQSQPYQQGYPTPQSNGVDKYAEEQIIPGAFQPDNQQRRASQQNGGLIGINATLPRKSEFPFTCEIRYHQPIPGSIYGKVATRTQPCRLSPGPANMQTNPQNPDCPVIMETPFFNPSCPENMTADYMRMR